MILGQRATTLWRMDAAVDTPLNELQPTLQRLRDAWQARRPDIAQRRADLQRLRAAFAARIDSMDAAIRADFGHRSTHENLISEAMIVLAEPMSIAIESDTRLCKAPTPRNAAVFRMNAIARHDNA